jgi:hypothetical protein
LLPSPELDDPELDDLALAELDESPEAELLVLPESLPVDAASFGAGDDDFDFEPLRLSVL